MNDMKQRVVEIIRKTTTVLTGSCGTDEIPLDDYSRKIVESISHQLADALIEAGVVFNPETDIRPKFKVGQEVWYKSPNPHFTKSLICNAKICGIYIRCDNCVLYELDMGDYSEVYYSEDELFATESEVQAALDKLKE